MKRKDNCIQCDSCDEWIHLKCSRLSREEFNLLSHSETIWCCSKCNLDSLPFHNLNNGELLLENLGNDCTKVDELSLTPNSYNDFIRECQKLSINSDDKPLLDQDDNFYTQINSQYYDI